MRLSEAVILFAFIQGAVIAVPELTPAEQTGGTTLEMKGGHLPVRSAGTACSSQTWPNLAAACLRNVSYEQRAVKVRVVTAMRQ